MKKHISYSEWKDWKVCPYFHKLRHIDKIGIFEGNIYTAFGKALHEAIEKDLVSENAGNVPKMEENFKYFFKKELQSLPEGEKKQILSNFDVKEWLNQGNDIVKEVFSALVSEFGPYGERWEVLAAEEQLYEEIEGSKKKFKGFIDLVMFNHADQKVYIIDWKTTSWGWDSRKKSNSTLAYQLAFYKYFYGKKYDIELKDMETYFVLLKRTAKSGKKVEFVRVSNGERRIKNALNALQKAIYNIENGNHIKNKLNCNSCADRFGKCEFMNTEHCR